MAKLPDAYGRGQQVTCLVRCRLHALALEPYVGL